MLLLNNIHRIIILLLLKKTLLTSCEDSSLSPNEESDCTNLNSDKTTCCFAELTYSNGTTKNKCMEINDKYRFALGFLTSINYENEDVNINFSCGINFQTCGTDNPKKLFQCREHTSLSKSCCMIKFDNDDTDCILADYKVTNPINFKLFEKIEISCCNFFYKCKFQILFILLLFLF